MEARKILFVMNSSSSQKSIMSEAETLGALKADMRAAGINYDNMTFFEGRLEGKVAKEPAGDGGYGWDRLFIPNGYDITRAQMDEADYRATYLKIKPLENVKKFLLEN